MVSATSGYYCYDLPNFAPASIEVSSGRTVAFMLTDYCYTQANAHNIVFEDDPTTTASSGTHVRTFTGPPGVIRYRCTKHSTSFTEGMVGTITIR
jgi:plastocyanin